jgi:hypothetical protein
VRVRRRRHHDHRLETTTDVRVRRLRMATGDGYVAFGWDYPGSTLLEVRILRSGSGCAESPDAVGDQRVVYDDVGGSFRDTGLDPGARYHYTVFARHPGGEWVLWERSKLRAVPPRPPWLRRLLPWAAAVLVVTAALAGATVATAENGDEAAPEAPTAEQAALEQAARADPAVASVLAGVEAEVQAQQEGAALSPLGDEVVFGWPSEQARDVTVDWPVLDRAADGADAETRRLKLEELSAMVVVVDSATGSVREVFPTVGATQYVVREDVTTPWSRVPWLVERPWLPLPLFMAGALALVVHALVRSRAWRRRTPSMARHDRQALGRLAVIAYLLAALVLQIWVVVTAALEELPYQRAFDPGSLQVLPVLFFPAALYLAALVLELLSGTHRGSWALVALMAAASYVYSVVIMVRVATDDVTLLLSLLLGALMLIGLPRAFGVGRMGWSRSAAFSRA